MPRLSDTMTEGVIAAWHVQKGDKVSNGDLLAEVETDKATMDVESFYDGTILHIGVDEGEALPVGQLLVVIGEEDEDISGLLSGDGSEAAAPAEAKEEAAAQPEVEAQESAPAHTNGSGQLTPAPVSTAPAGNGSGRVKASPLAKAIARDRGIDLHQVQGTGDSGRIVKRDIERFQPAQQPPAVPQPEPVQQPVQQPSAVPQPEPVQQPAQPPAQPPAPEREAPAAQPAPMMPGGTGQEDYEEVRVSQMRKTIARRLAESKFTAPHFYVTMEINMGKAVEVRKQLNEMSPVKISFNDMVIKAAAVGLRQHPGLNAAWMEDKVRYNKHIHVGMAVAVDEGLLVPVIRFADTKGLSTIAGESKSLAGMARDRTLQPKDWEGNTFTVSNLGMFGVEEFTAIINPPDSCILAIGGIIDKPVVQDGEIVPGKMMKVTLSCDHRVVDGAMGAAFLQTLKGLLEDPMRMLI